MELSHTLLKRKKLRKISIESDDSGRDYQPPQNATTKITTLLRFAKKANQFVFGFDAVAKQIQKKRVCLLLLASDLAQGTADKIRKIAQDIDVIIWADILTYQDIIGKYTGIVGITDDNFKKGIKDAYKASWGGCQPPTSVGDDGNRL